MIGDYLVQQRRRLILSYKQGFASNPATIPRINVVSELTELRREEFSSFRKGLTEDYVVLIKVLTAVDLPSLQEGLLLGDLRGNLQLINLQEICRMSDEERRAENGPLYDVRTLLVDDKYLRIVDNVPDLVKFCERIFVKLKPEQVTGLASWHPKMETDLWGGIKYEFPTRYASWVRAFAGTTHPGWKWELQEDPETLGEEQARLVFACGAAMVGLALDGITLRLFATEGAKAPARRMAEILGDVMAEEDVEALERFALQGKDEAEKKSRKRQVRHVKFKSIQGVTLADSMAFGLMRIASLDNMKEGPSRKLVARRQFILDLVEWEESLDWIEIVPALPMVFDPALVMPEPKKACLKPFEKEKLRYDVGYVTDPDIWDRGRLRFPSLNVTGSWTSKRTASPPPRQDDPNGLNEENWRRLSGLRMQGPPCKPGVPKTRVFVRNITWEMTLPDVDVSPYQDKRDQHGAKRSNSPELEKPVKRSRNRRTSARNRIPSILD